MKHFNAQTGGRYTYTDDIVNLQELVLSLNSIFQGCDNFIISGCEPSANSVAPGFVYINGEIRKFSGASNITQWPLYIYESNKVENVTYASGGEKVGRTVYSCSSSKDRPTQLDPVTKAAPGYITVKETGGLTIKDALYGKYALLLDPVRTTQVIKSNVEFSNKIDVRGAMTVNDVASVISGNSKGEFYWEGDKFITKVSLGSGKINKFVVSEEGIEFCIGEKSILKISNNGTSSKDDITTTGKVNASNVTLTGIHIYNSGTTGDEGTLNINMLGYNGGSTLYRNTVIGNGKNAAIMTVNGNESKVYIDGRFEVKTGDTKGFVLKSTNSKANLGSGNNIVWKDVTNEDLAILGFISGERKFALANKIGGINITGLNGVDIAPHILENGVPLSAKYVLVSNYKDDMAKKADADKFYTIVNADKVFVRKDGGLSQFLTTSNTAEVLRNSIDAVDLPTVKKTCAVLTNCLSDMATTESAKERIRMNIGAEKKGAFEPKMLDTGWRTVIYGKLYARQIGKMVCIQGHVDSRAGHGKELFTIPTSIGAPAYNVCFRADSCTFGAWISGGSRTCYVSDSSTHKSISFSMTYMTA